MDISFILSKNELFTLISMMPGRTDAGARFIELALSGAVLCDLNGLKEKKLARIVNDKPEPVSVIRMIADSVSRADSAQLQDGAWKISSPWALLRCEACPYQEGHIRITVIEGCL